jgi:hypothetical protein
MAAALADARAQGLRSAEGEFAGEEAAPAPTEEAAAPTAG